MDPFLLCSIIPPLINQTILDIGCGVGIMPLILKSINPDVKIFGIEIQKELAQFARKNIKNNLMGENIHIICKDIRKVVTQDFDNTIDIIVSNPPYKKKNSGRLNPDKQKAIARHEIKLDIKELIICCKRLLVPDGSLYIIFPAERISDLLSNMNKHRLTPETIQFVHTKKNAPAKLVIVCGANNKFKKSIREQPIIIPSLFIYDYQIALPGNL